MTTRKPHGRRPRVRPQSWQVINPHAAGIDVGSAEHWVAVAPDADPQPVRSFGACTADLEALADWLQATGVTSVVMESTGVYWIPLFEVLQRRGFEARLVDARQSKRVPGRPKSDVYDCQWLQRLHACGLLAAAFHPDDAVCVLRGFLRQRAMLITCASQHIQHMQKALEQMNVKLTEVVSDVTGVTGMAIIQAILAGERDPLKLARLRDPRCKQDEAAIARALYGNWRAEHLLSLKQAVALYECYQRQVEECDRHIEAHLQTFQDKSQGQNLPPRPRRQRKHRAKHKANTPSFDARKHLHRVSGVDLTAIEGIGEDTGLVLISEIGLDLSRFPTAKQFCSWLGLCPVHKISGGKVLSRRVRPGASRAAQALRLAARSLLHSQSALGAFVRRMKGRLGAAKAIVAGAHKLARLVYSLLKHGQAYVAQGLDEYEKEYRQRREQAVRRQAQALGYELTPLAAPA